MRRWVAAVLSALVLGNVFAEEELPPSDPNESLEIEPPLLVPLRAPDGSIPDPPGSAAAVSVDMAKLETELARAEKRASGADRLFRAGIIAKVDAEQRALKVVQLKAALAEARLQQAKAAADEAGAAADGALAEVAAAAKQATEERHRAEIEQAIRNLQRQKKLLALGSGRKADVSRAEQKLAELQQSDE
jgi:hypothetical protein